MNGVAWSEREGTWRGRAVSQPGIDPAVHGASTWGGGVPLTPFPLRTSLPLSVSSLVVRFLG